jgi:hypothetical protein
LHEPICRFLANSAPCNCYALALQLYPL